jgi:A/G-specific adenine glycosylase
MRLFTKTIIDWYGANARDLPWRRTRDPYRIWISEVILQQTRVVQGMDYYSRFLERFPSIDALANADEQEVLKTWQGLGYYSRARNMHAAAKEIIEKHGGIFPDSYEKLLKLKGIGEYTAAAIASVSFDQPVPVVDGNVLRFFSRYFGMDLPIDSTWGKKAVYEKALLLIDGRQPGIFNQAIMEFGALQCTPMKPGCKVCPFSKNCFAFKKGMVEQLPVKSKPKKQKTRYFNYFVILVEGENGEKSVYLRKRETNDVWMNLYDFPMIETVSQVSGKFLFSSPGWKEIIGNEIHYRVVKRSSPIRHILTHQVIFATFCTILVDPGAPPLHLFPLVPFDEIKDYPVPRLIEEFFRKNMVSI